VISLYNNNKYGVKSVIWKFHFIIYGYVSVICGYHKNFVYLLNEKMKYAGHSWSKQTLGYLADKNIISYFNKDNRYINIVKYTWLSVD